MQILKYTFILLISFGLLVNCNKEQTTEVLSKPCVIPDIEKILIENSNQFGIYCFKQLSLGNEMTENILVSPIGISSSLISLLQASNNHTNTEIKQILNINNVKDSIILKGFDHLNNLYSEIDYNSKIKNSSKIALSKDVFLEPKYKSIDKNSRFTEIIFDEDAGFIEDIHDKFSESDVNSFQMINAFNFSSKSKYEVRVEESPFYKSPNESNFVEMIVSKSELNYYSDQTVKAVELPLGRGNFNILLIVPQNTESLKDLCKKLDIKLLERIKKKFRPQKLEVIMPKMELSGIKTLKGILKSNHLSSGFKKTSADFSQLSKQNNLYLSDFEHITNLNISSNGIEKADPSTDSYNNGNSFLIDHPFIFIIYEKYSQGILFIGKIANL